MSHDSRCTKPHRKRVAALICVQFLEHAQTTWDPVLLPQQHQQHPQTAPPGSPHISHVSLWPPSSAPTPSSPRYLALVEAVDKGNEAEVARQQRDFLRELSQTELHVGA